MIWPKGGGSHPAARLLRIVAQITFWCGVVYLLAMLGNDAGIYGTAKLVVE